MSARLPSANSIRHFRKAVEALPPMPKTVFLLNARDGIEYREIAERLGISVQKVEQLLAKAIVFLDATLDGTSERENLI